MFLDKWLWFTAENNDTRTIGDIRCNIAKSVSVSIDQ